MKWKLLLIIPLVVTSFVGVGGTIEATGSRAEETGLKFSIVGNGGYYSVNAKEGKQYDFDFIIKNISSESKNFTVYNSDTYTAMKGSPSYKSPQETNKLYGDWLKGVNKSYSLGPGKSVKVTYSGGVPNGVREGEYLSSVVVQSYGAPIKTSNNSQESATFMERKEYKQGIPVVFRVGTKFEDSLMLPDPEYGFYESGKFYMHLPFDDVGTRIQKPYGKITLYKGNNVMDTEEYLMGSVYPGTIGIYPFEPKTKLTAGEYKLIYDVNYSGKKDTKEFMFTVTPQEVRKGEAHEQGLLSPKFNFFDFLKMWWWALLLFFLIFFFFILLWKRRKKKDEEETQSNKRKQSGRKDSKNSDAFDYN